MIGSGELTYTNQIFEFINQTTHADKGNDLITPRPEFGFPGLKAGDGWCLCALRWEEAREAGCAPRVKLTSTNIKTLEMVDFEHLKAHQMDLN